MSAKKLITVFGATGNQGGSVVQIFLNDPKLKSAWSVRGVSRNASSASAQKLVAQGVEMVSADMDDKASLVSAMKGSDTVFTVTNYWDKMDMKLEIQQGKNLADAAKETGVKHFIWSSLLNVTKLTNGKLPHVYHFDSKALVEDYVRELGIPASFFLPGFFMSNLPGGMLREANGAWTLSLPMPQTAPIPMFLPADTGKWIKALVLTQTPPAGKRVYAATAYQTPDEILADFKEVYPEAGKTATFYELPHDKFLGAMKAQGMPDFAAEEMLENMRLMNEGGYYGGESLDGSHALLQDESTTWKEFTKSAPAFANLK